MDVMTMNAAIPSHSQILLSALPSSSSSSAAVARARRIISLTLPKYGRKLDINSKAVSSIFARSSALARHRLTMQSGVHATDRLVAALGYFLPFFNGLHYGRYFFMQYPKAELIFEPLLPIIHAYKSIPYASFIAFFALYLAVVRNPSFSRYVRFNTMQAVVLDVLLVLPLIFQRIFSPRRCVGFNLMIIGYNVAFLFLVACFVYSVVSCILGTSTSKSSVPGRIRNSSPRSVHTMGETSHAQRHQIQQRVARF